MEPQQVNLFLQKFKAHRFISTLTIAITLAVGILIGSVVSHGVKGSQAQNSSSDATPLQVPAAEELSNTFTKITKQLEPAMVNIHTESTVKPTTRGRRRATPPGGDNGPGGDQQDPFQDFFDRFFG